jgi:glycosyltransferase involved in cell wall biosynthesis
MNDPVWVFFAAEAKPTSMRRAVAERLTEKETVLIVERPVSVLRDRKTPPLKLRRERIQGFQNLWLYRPLHYPERLPGLGRVMKLGNRCRLQRELDQLLPQNARRILCYDSPTHEYLAGKLGEDLSIYLAIDDLTITVTGESIKGELDAERQLLSKVHLVICISDVLAQRLRERSPSSEKPPIRVLPNGYDERIFNPNGNYTEPNALHAISRPRILVTGHISERIDWDGIIGASRLRTPWTWIFIGPADNGMKERITSRLGQHGFYHSRMPVQEVPAWIYHCDACAVPYRLNPFTRASSPLKAIEYLAMGAPVLSTRIPSLDRYNGVIEWVNEGDGESYARALDGLTNQVGSQEIRELRRRAVSGDSWGVRVNQFREIVFYANS